MLTWQQSRPQILSQQSIDCAKNTLKWPWSGFRWAYPAVILCVMLGFYFIKQIYSFSHSVNWQSNLKSSSPHLRQKMSQLPRIQSNVFPPSMPSSMARHAERQHCAIAPWQWIICTYLLWPQEQRRTSPPRHCGTRWFYARLIYSSSRTRINLLPLPPFRCCIWQRLCETTESRLL